MRPIRRYLLLPVVPVSGPGTNTFLFPYFTSYSNVYKPFDNGGQKVIIVRLNVTDVYKYRSTSNECVVFRAGHRIRTVVVIRQ